MENTVNNTFQSYKEKITEFMKEAIESTLQSEPYNHNRASKWTNFVIDKILEKLLQLNLSYQYIGEFLFIFN
ncbi:dynein light chain tctex-type [Anaeramoeba ignava]|uniref:Dynein light chain tctex-type n=1 Tax=Anaeramoeba ignava TaxID=1746090 RepID=A0A9Q0R8R9_ANAIG|nr:dynein light chain tctex-type [Anaeramoeba ignava]